MKVLIMPELMEKVFGHMATRPEGTTISAKELLHFSPARHQLGPTPSQSHLEEKAERHDRGVDASGQNLTLGAHA